MGLGERQQGEIAYLRGALGLDELEARVAKLENQDEYVGKTLEERHSRGLANLAALPSTTMTPYSPEGEPDPETEEDKEEWVPEGTPDQSETVQESNPASEGTSFEDDEDLDLDALLEEDKPYEDWTVNQIRAELSRRGQPVSGNKNELIDRLEQGDQDIRQ